jgi:hypothetical protein
MVLKGFSMGKINLDEVAPGMVLAADVFEIHGGLLAVAGNEISEKSITIFRKWGIRELEVEGITSEILHDEKLATLDPEQMQKIEKKVTFLFRHITGEDSFIKELKQLCSMRLITRVKEGARL